jgi:hypothetical protein
MALFHAARNHHEACEVAPGWNVYPLDAEWRGGCEAAEIEPRNLDCHCLKFCGNWPAKRAAP